MTSRKTESNLTAIKNSREALIAERDALRAQLAGLFEPRPFAYAQVS